MDKKLLDQYDDMLQEQEDLKKRIGKSRARLEDLEGQTVQDSVLGGEGGIQHFHIEGYPYRDIEREKDILRHRIACYENLQTRIGLSIKQIDQFISECDNARILRIIEYRYHDHMTWHDIAKKFGPGNTEDAIKKEFYRYVDKK